MPYYKVIVSEVVEKTYNNVWAENIEQARNRALFGFMVPDDELLIDVSAKADYVQKD